MLACGQGVSREDPPTR